MNLELWTFSWLDKYLKLLLNINIEEEKEFHRRRDNIENLSRKNILHDMEIIDSKSSALLTHISIILIVLLFLFDKTNNTIFNLFVLIELLIYIIMAALLLRCVEFMGPPYNTFSNQDELNEDIYYKEIAFRKAIYVRVVRIVFFLTLMLIPTALFKYLII